MSDWKKELQFVFVIVVRSVRIWQGKKRYGKMDEKKVREVIKYFKKEIDFAERRKSDCSEIMLSVFEDEIDTDNIVIEALEKQLSKKGIKEKITDGTNKGLHKFYCPICYRNGDLSNKCNVGLYCSDCGQKLDWTAEE